MTTKNISAATVTYFSDLNQLRLLLSSIQDAAEDLFEKAGYRFDYYIIDNSNDDAYFRQLKSLSTGSFDANYFLFHLVRSSSNLGYSGGNNLVLSRLKSDYHIVLNPDVTVQRDSLWKAVGYMNGNRNVAMLSPRVFNEQGGSHVVKAYPDCFTLMLRYLGHNSLNRLFAARLKRYQCDHLKDQADKTVELAGGCFQFIRTELFQQLQGFDERFFMYFEDYDLSIRAKALGVIAYVPSVKITHEGGDVGRKRLRHHLFFCVSAVKFFTRHTWRLW